MRVLEVTGAGQPKRMVGELRCSEGGAASARRSRRLLENRRGRSVRQRLGESKVMGALLLAAHDLGEPGVKCSSRGFGLPGRHGRSEQGMGEPHAVLVELEELRVDGLEEPDVGCLSESCHDERGRRIRDGGDDVRDLGRARPKRVDTLAQQLVEGGGNRQRLSRGERRAAPGERGGELEREERVAGRCLPQPDQRRSWECRREARAEQLVRGAEAEAADLESPPGLALAGYVGATTAGRPGRSAARLAVHRPGVTAHSAAPRGTPRRATGGRRRRHRALVRGERSQRREEGGRHGPLVDLGLGLAEQQSDLERSPLDRWEHRKDLSTTPERRSDKPA